MNKNKKQENWAKRETLTEREILALALIGVERILHYLVETGREIFKNYDEETDDEAENKAKLNDIEERIKGMKFKKCRLEKLIDKFDKGEQQ